MWRPLEIVLRFVAIGILLFLTGALLRPPASQGSPYLSALADLTAGTALAGQGCGYKACQFVHGKIACARTGERENCKSGGGYCESKPCP
jgi:hypothetical protein